MSEETDDGPDRAAEDAGETPDVLADPEEPPDPAEEADLPPEEVDRVFSVMDEALTGDAVGESQAERLLSVLERAVASPSDTDRKSVV